MPDPSLVLTVAQALDRIQGLGYAIEDLTTWPNSGDGSQIVAVKHDGVYEVWRVGGSVLKTIVGTVPAAGAEAIEVVPAAKKWRVNAYSVVRTNAGVGGNRGHSIVVDAGVATRRYLMIDIGTATTVGTTRTLLWTFGNATSAIGPLGTSDSGESLIIPDKLPYDVVIPAGYRLRTVTTGGDAADTYTGIFIQVEEWDAS